MSGGLGHEISPEALGRFAEKRATPVEAQLVLCHLLAGCEICRRHLRSVGWYHTARDTEPSIAHRVPAVRPAGTYDEAFAAAERALDKALQRRERSVEALLAELDRLPIEQQELRVRNLRRYASPELSAALVERSHAARFSDHRETLRAARLAVAAAEAATPSDTTGPAALNDCRARAWAQLANALRIRSDVVESERAFAAALRLLEQGTGSPALRAGVLELLASLRLFQRDFATATVLLDETVAIYHRLRDRAGEAGALIRLALGKIRAGNPEEAIAPLQDALRLLTTHDVELLRMAVHNLTYCYVEMGEARLAYGLMVDSEPHFAGCADKVVLLRTDWLRGRIERDLGLLDAAELRLARVREAYLREDLALEVGIVSLDLAEVYARQKRIPDLVRTIGETIPIFQGLGVFRELLTSLLRLKEIAHSESAAIALIRQISEQIKSALPQAT